MSEFKFLDQTEDFFDDGDNNTFGRIDPGEKLEDFDLHEADDEEIQRVQQSFVPQAQPEEHDFRMEARGAVAASTTADRPPKTLFMGSQNTGPKGVKKDYEDSKRAATNMAQMEQLRRNRLIDQHTSGKRQYFIDSSNTVASYSSTSKFYKGHDKLFTDDSGTSTSMGKSGLVGSESAMPASSTKLAENGDDTEYSILKRSREAMLRRYQDELIEHQGELCGRYHKLNTVDDVASLVKSVHHQGYTIIHVYDNSNPTCQILHLIFEDISTMFHHVVFSRAKSSDIMPSFDSRFLPTLLIYQGPNLIDKIIGLTGLVGLSPEDDDVVKLLNDKNLLAIPTGGFDKPTDRETQAFIKLRSKQVTSMTSGGDDDDDDWLNDNYSDDE